MVTVPNRKTLWDAMGGQLGDKEVQLMAPGSSMSRRQMQGNLSSLSLCPRM